MSAEAYPLSWPLGWSRTRSPEHSRFKTGFGAARKQLFDELARMNATKIILSTNIPLRNDGLPRANMRPDGGDSGVAVYFQRKGKSMVFACDKFRGAEENIYAIAKTIDAMRGIERWGASDMMERAFSGFKALAATSGEHEDPWTVLGISAMADADIVTAAYRALAKSAHPDSPGGSHDQMSRINSARDRCLAALKA